MANFEQVPASGEEKRKGKKELYMYLCWCLLQRKSKVTIFIPGVVQLFCAHFFSEILQVRQSIIANYSAFPLKGIDTYSEMISNTAIIPSGIERFVPYCYRFMGLLPPLFFHGFGCLRGFKSYFLI
jgi:hypothetical protein